MLYQQLTAVCKWVNHYLSEGISMDSSPREITEKLELLLNKECSRWASWHERKAREIECAKEKENR